MRHLALGIICALFAVTTLSAQSYTNWETPPVHPIEITPDGNTLLVANLADARLEIYDITSGAPVSVASVPVGVDPVSVRARTDGEAWIANSISDSVSIVDLVTRNVRATLTVGDEPGDVVFAGSPERAFITMGQESEVWVFDPADLAAPPTVLSIFGEEPRALARSADGSQVYAAIFDSGNGTTILGGGGAGGTLGFPPNVVNSPLTPYAGVNPPPNDGAAWEPPLNPALPAPIAVGLIVRQIGGAWLDDNGSDWTSLVSGPEAAQSGRPVGWNLPDHDVAVIDAATLAVTYIDHLMTNDMAIAVHPTTGAVTVVGTEAINEIRFEPNLTGIFVRTHIAFAAPDGSSSTVSDLNPHLDYLSSSIPLSERALSLGDPRAIVWNAAGTTGWVAGKGSGNIIQIDGSGSRVSPDPIVVGLGPTGLALDEPRARLYIHQHFDGSVAAIDTSTGALVATAPFFDPTPEEIRIGRPHLYDTHATSGLGQLACASCHIDARMDRLAWDLGNPAGAMRPFTGNCNNTPLLGVCPPYHPMKGPMTTQTLQDIIGKEPHHWRGDRDGIEEFAGAFAGLLGDDAPLDSTSMQEFEDFLATIVFPPNPYRSLDNNLPTSLPLPGHFTTGRFLPAGQPLPNGNAVTGLSRYRTAGLDGGLQCVTCHTLPVGIGANVSGVPFNPQFIPLGPNGERHHAIVNVDGSTNVSMKTPHLRNIYKKTGFQMTQLSNTSGFGMLHDGSVDSIERFVSEPVFSVVSDQDVANLVAFMLSFGGSELPLGTLGNPFELPGPASQDSHSAIGVQVTFHGANNGDAALIDVLELLQAEALAARLDIIAKGIRNGEARGWRWNGLNTFQSDRAGETISIDTLRIDAAAGEEITFTAVPLGNGVRTGIDRDEDGVFDRDELDGCSDPADPLDVPVVGGCGGDLFERGDCNSDGAQDISDAVFLLMYLFSGGAGPICEDACDTYDGGDLNIADAVALLGAIFGAGPAPSPPTVACGVDPTADALSCTTTPTCP
jgi:YVTN family beta-propeller protein